MDDHLATPTGAGQQGSACQSYRAQDPLCCAGYLRRAGSVRRPVPCANSSSIIEAEKGRREEEKRKKGNIYTVHEAGCATKLRDRLSLVLRVSWDLDDFANRLRDPLRKPLRNPLRKPVAQRPTTTSIPASA